MVNFWPLQIIDVKLVEKLCFRYFFKTRHVFVKHGCPRRQQSQNMANISKSYILTPPHPEGHVMSVKCEEPKVWLLYHHQNFKYNVYCILFVSGTELQQTDKEADKRTIRLLDAPGGPFRRGNKNAFCLFNFL